MKKLFGALKPHQQSSSPYPVDLYGSLLYAAGSRSETGEWMIVVTNQSPENAMTIYLRR